MTFAVLRKELGVLWLSPLPYVVGVALHAAVGLLVANQLDVRDQAVLQPLVPIAGFLLLFAVPVLTMRSFAEEARSGALDLLLAIPVPPRPLVVGKWLAAWLSALVVLAPLLVVVGLVARWGDPDFGPVIAGGLGLVLLAGVLAALGVAASACTASQPVAAMVAIFVAVVAWFASTGASGLRTGGLLAALSFSERLETFSAGGIDTADAAYFLCGIVGAIAVASFAVDARRLR